MKRTLPPLVSIKHGSYWHVATVKGKRKWTKLSRVKEGLPAMYLALAALNVAEPWTKLSLPLLVVYGTADFVTAEEDHRRIVDMVNAAHPGNATLKLIAGMNHRLQVSGTQQEDFDRGKKGGSGPYDERFSAALRESVSVSSVPRLGWISTTRKTLSRQST